MFQLPLPGLDLGGLSSSHAPGGRGRDLPGGRGQDRPAGRGRPKGRGQSPPMLTKLDQHHHRKQLRVRRYIKHKTIYPLRHKNITNLIHKKN